MTDEGMVPISFHRQTTPQITHILGKHLHAKSVLEQGSQVVIQKGMLHAAEALLNLAL